MPHAHVHHSSHQIPLIFDNNLEYDPLPSFAFARDRPRRRRLTSSLGPLHREPPNITPFESFECPYQIRPPANRSLRFRNVVSMRWQPVFSRSFPYDRDFYQVWSLCQKPMTCQTSQSLRGTSVQYSFHYLRASKSPILSGNRAFRQSYKWELCLPTIAKATPMRRLLLVSSSALSLKCPQRLNSQRIRRCTEIEPQVHGLDLLLRHCQSRFLICDNYNVYHPD